MKQYPIHFRIEFVISEGKIKELQETDKGNEQTNW